VKHTEGRVEVIGHGLVESLAKMAFLARFLSTATKAWSREQLEDVASWAQTFTSSQIPKGRMEISFNRSRGPGGQNVNKVNTKAEVRFVLQAADWMPEYTRIKLGEQEANRISKEGHFIITSERNRTQTANLDDCFVKLHEMIVKASEIPKEPDEEQRQHVRSLAKAADARRMQEKRRNAEKKQGRRSTDF